MKLYDADARITYDIYPAIKMFVRTPVRGKGLSSPQPLVSLAACSGREGLAPGAQRVAMGRQFDQLTERYQMRREDGTGAETTEVELFPGLGCLAGGLTGEWKNSATGAVSRQTERVASLQKLNTTDAAYFTVPPGYREGTPSEVMKAYSELRGQPCAQCLLNTGARADDNHRRAWQNRSSRQP